MHYDGISRLVLQRQRVDVAVANLSRRIARLRQTRARVGQHGLIDIDTETPRVAISQQLQRAAGSRAQIEKERERTRPQRVQHSRFDISLRDMQCADAVPIGSVILKKFLCGRLAVALQGLGSLPVPAGVDVGGIYIGDEAQGEAAAGGTIRNVEINPAPFPEAFDEPRLDQ